MAQKPQQDAPNTNRMKKDLLRQCALKKCQLPVEELIRFVLSPEEVVTPDLRGKLPGRGLWLSADRTSIELATKKNLFERAFRKKIIVNDDLADIIYKITRSEALASLSLANKAGLVITGYEKIKRALGKGHVKWLLHAIEAADNGSDKLDRFFAPSVERPEKHEDPQKVNTVLQALFTGEELSLALGRSNVIHIGLKRGKIAHRFVFALQRMDAFKPDDEGSPLKSH